MKSCSGNIILLVRIPFYNFILLMLTGWNSDTKCPPNINFESGNFSGWQCFTGLIEPGNIMLPFFTPMKNRHEIYYRKGVTENDYRGGFPKFARMAACTLKELVTTVQEEALRWVDRLIIGFIFLKIIRYFIMFGAGRTQQQSPHSSKPRTLVVTVSPVEKNES